MKKDGLRQDMLKNKLYQEKKFLSLLRQLLERKFLGVYLKASIEKSSHIIH